MTRVLTKAQRYGLIALAVEGAFDRVRHMPNGTHEQRIAKARALTREIGELKGCSCDTVRHG